MFQFEKVEYSGVLVTSMNSESLTQAAKTIGIVLVFIFAVIVLPVLYSYGLVWFSEKVLPWLFVGCLIASALCLLVLLPLSVIRKLRPWMGFLQYLVSYLFGTLLFLFSCLVVVQLWGYFGLLVGLFLGGVGVVPVAFLAALFHKEWTLLGYVLLGTVVTFGIRYLGVRLMGLTSDEDELRVQVLESE